MKQKYFDRDEKLGFFEELVYDHKLDEDVMLITRAGVSIEFVRLAFLVVICILAAICF
jgi:hypothetical protein